MKELCLFSLLLLIVIVGAEDAIQYHGERRYYTVEHDGQTYIGLHVLNEPVKITFHKDKKFDDLAPVIKLYSPTSNGKCEDGPKLQFKLVIDAHNFIRGEIKKEAVAGGAKNVRMYLYENCGTVNERYAGGIIEDAKLNLDAPLRACFRNPDTPFKPHGSEDKEMELQVTLPPGDDFKCQIFMILPHDICLEDIALADNGTLPLNETWAATNSDPRFWWKITNPDDVHAPRFPASIKFADDRSGNVVIDMLKSTKDVPLVFRIGKGQPVPSFVFKFDSCNDKKFDIYFNRRDDCGISIRPTAAGFKLTPKDAAAEIEIKDATKSPTLVFGEVSGKNYVYVKVAPPSSNQSQSSDDLRPAIFIEKYEICGIPKVSEDEIVLQIVPPGDAAGTCNTAKITLPKKDVAKEIEVLIANPDQYLLKTTLNPNNDSDTINTTLASASTTEPSHAYIQFWWFVVALLLVMAIVIAVFVYIFAIRTTPCCCCPDPYPTNPGPRPPRRKRQAEAAAAPAKGETEVKTAIAKTESPKKKSKKSKKNKKKHSKKDKKEKKDTSGSGPKQKKPKSKSPERPKESDTDSPYGLLPRPKQDQLPVARTQQTTGVDTTQYMSEREPVEKQIISRQKLKYRGMYGPGGFAVLDQPFNYHSNESPTYEATINFSALKVGSTPDMKQFDSFWSCIQDIADPQRCSSLCVSSKIPGKSIFFLVRDCVADDSLYLPFRGLSNRMLEPLKGDAIDAARKQSAEQTTGDGGEQVFFVLRVFVLSYEPLTLEVHCRGQCPGFIFNVFDCDQCADIGKRLQKNAWLNSQATCREDWETFLCRAKRTPCNNHQFLSYSGPEKPKSSDEVNHVLIVRGNKRPNMLRPCTRGCCFKDMSHRNGFDFQADLLADPTYETQATQQNSST